MIEIAICDDSKNTVKQLTEIVNSYAKKNCVEIRVDVFYDGVDLVSKDNKYDLYMLDIDMPVLDGIETAKEIRKKDKDCKTIFITNYSDFMQQAFSVRAYGYIIKPLNVSVIEKELNDFFDTCSRKKIKHQIVFNEKLREVTLYIEDIYYFEVIGKNSLNVSLGDRTVTVHSSLNDVCERLKKYEFAKPHQSFLVNLDYVYMLEGLDILMKNGERLCVAQKRVLEFRKRLFNYLHRYL